MKKHLLLFLFGLGFVLGRAQTSAKNHSLEIFDELWTEFDMRYANFDLKQVDWNKVYEIYRPMVINDITDRELFDICCSMLQELKDGHVSIETKINSTQQECGPPYAFKIELEFPEAKDGLAYNNAITETLSSHEFGKMKRILLTEETNFQFASSTNYGYLRMDEMMEALKLGKLKKALNTAFSAFQDTKGLIIDLRLNGGGWDVVSYKLAGRLIGEKQTGHYKKTRIKGSNDFKKLKEYKIIPTGKKPYAGDLIVLTSDYTASAAEVFLLAIMDLPNVKIIGDKTEGIFSDMFFFKLKNDWEVSLSHQQFFSREMVNYEGVGIEPTIELRNSRVEALNNQDALIEKALEMLESNNEN